MKKHSKVLATLASLLLLANVPLLSACGNDKNKEEDNTPDNGSTVTPTPTPIAEKAYNVTLTKDDAEALLLKAAPKNNAHHYALESGAQTAADPEKIITPAEWAKLPTDTAADKTDRGDYNEVTNETYYGEAFYKVGNSLNQEQVKLILEQMAQDAETKDYAYVMRDNGTNQIYINSTTGEMYIDGTNPQWVKAATTADLANYTNSYWLYTKNGIKKEVITNAKVAELQGTDTITRLQTLAMFVDSGKIMKDVKIEDENIIINLDKDVEIKPYGKAYKLGDVFGEIAYTLENGRIVAETYAEKITVDDGNFKTSTNTATKTNKYTYYKGYESEVTAETFALPVRTNGIAYEWALQKNYSNTDYQESLKGDNFIVTTSVFSAVVATGNAELAKSGETFSVTNKNTWAASVDEDAIAAAFIAGLVANTATNVDDPEQLKNTKVTAKETNYAEETITTTTYEYNKGAKETVTDLDEEVQSVTFYNNIGTIAEPKFAAFATNYNDGVATNSYNDNDGEGVTITSPLAEYAIAGTFSYEIDDTNVIVHATNAYSNTFRTLDSSKRVVKEVTNTTTGKVVKEYSFSNGAYARTENTAWVDAGTANVGKGHVYLNIEDISSDDWTLYTKWAAKAKDIDSDDSDAQAAAKKAQTNAFKAANAALRTLQSHSNTLLTTLNPEKATADFDKSKYIIVSTDNSKIYVNDVAGNQEIWYEQNSTSGKWTSYTLTNANKAANKKGVTLVETDEVTAPKTGAEAALAEVSAFYTNSIPAWGDDTTSDKKKTTYKNAIKTITVHENEGYIDIELQDVTKSVKDGDKEEVITNLYTAQNTEPFNIVKNKIVKNGLYYVKSDFTATIDADKASDYYTAEAMKRLNRTSYYSTGFDKSAN